VSSLWIWEGPFFDLFISIVFFAMEDLKFCFFVAFQPSLLDFEHPCRPLLLLDVVNYKTEYEVEVADRYFS